MSKKNNNQISFFSVLLCDCYCCCIAVVNGNTSRLNRLNTEFKFQYSKCFNLISHPNSISTNNMNHSKPFCCYWTGTRLGLNVFFSFFFLGFILYAWKHGKSCIIVRFRLRSWLLWEIQGTRLILDKTNRWEMYCGSMKIIQNQYIY